MTEASDYTAKDIQVLEGLEGVRKRPAMYIGDIGKRGLHHLVYEITDNSIDENLAGYCKNIEITLKSDGSCTVKDDGRGIPTDIHPKTGKSALETVSGTLHAGGKFEKTAYKVSGGLHGVGMSVVNALSEWMEIEVHRDGKIHKLKYEYGKTSEGAKVTGDTNYRGTIVRFKPDGKIFQATGFDFDYLKERFMEVAFLNKGLRIILSDEKTQKHEEFFYEGGIVQFVEFLNKARTKLHAPYYLNKKSDNIEVEFAIQYSDSYNEMVYTFVNDIKTIEGGTHLIGFKTALTRVINDYARSKKIIKEDRKIAGEDAIEGLTAVLSVKIAEPQFEGQTKTKLGNSEIKGIVDSIAFDALKTYLEETPDVAKRIIAKTVQSMEAREAAQKAKELIRRKNIFETSILPGKLADCNEENPVKAELFLVEGDSAGGCFSGDTKVALADGRSLSFKELVKEHGQGIKNYCYTAAKSPHKLETNGANGGFSQRKELILHPRLTKNAEVIKIILDNGEEIVCTPDHKFMLNNGNYKEAAKLTAEDGLMTFYGGLKVAPRYVHKVKGKAKLDEKIDVYDIEVPGTHNFALASGVFVHNSSKMARDRQFQAILPLKGKILNVEKAPIHKVLTSEEIKAIVLSIGGGFKDDFDINKVRYHKIICMCDADVDGSHIRTLILTLFYRYFKQIIEKGYVYIAQPPLYKIKKGKSERYAYSDEELNGILKEFGEEGCEIQRYKGLGEMNPQQLWDTTMNNETRTLKKVTIEDVIKTDELFSILMGEEVEPRREFIEAYAKEAKNLDI